MLFGIKDYPKHFQKSFKSENEGLIDPEVIKKQLKDSLEKGKIDKDLFEKAEKQLDDLIEKAEFSDKERVSLAKEGKAMSDGSYPIRNESDLKNAVQAFGRAKDKDKTKSWIKKRAKELGKENLLPDDWKKAEENDIQKAEGSRGGEVIGHTTSGKAVYKRKYPGDKDYKKFTVQDHVDAAQLHKKEADKHFQEHHRLINESPRIHDGNYTKNLALHHQDVADSHAHHAAHILQEEQKSNLSSDEKKILADQKKKQIERHKKAHEYHSGEQLKLVAEQKKHEGKEVPIHVVNSYSYHRNEADHHLNELKKLDPDNYSYK